ncbi:unnamed protein product [Phytophthora fragariaefolia]|uniref:Unnamed protein product n=1 Tax=Phytophthora fragariaefolia TaxID=1490495 RepID=A0A9W6XIW6_9STRA|nr:unnamed protein product [Phytophthora fragariaefolia]
MGGPSFRMVSVALVQMESLGTTELAVLYDFFDDNDIIGDFILVPRETPLTATELSSHLKNFTVKRELASILPQATGPPDVWDGVASPEGGCQFQSSYWIEKVAEVQRERNAAVAQMRSDIVLLMEERESDVSSLHNQVQTLKGELETARASRKKEPASRSQGPRLRTAHVMNFLHEHTALMMNWPRLRDLLDHLESGTRVPQEWQTVITIMANDNLAFQAPPFVRMDPPQDEDDEETKESDPPTPDSFLDLSRGASTTKFRTKSSQLGKRASGSQSPKSNMKQATDGVQELPSEWVSSTSPCRPEEVPLPLSPAQARYPAALALAGKDTCLHSSFPLDDLTIMLLSMMYWHRLDSAPWTKYVPRRYFTMASVALEGLRRTGTHIPEWQVTPGPSLDDREIDLLESEDEAEAKAEKDDDYNPHQDHDDRVDDEDVIPDEASDGVLNVAQRTTKCRRLSQPSAGVSTPKKIRTKSLVKTKIKVGPSGKSKSGSGSSKKPRPKSGGSRR